jgi:hypothetical protein
VTEIPIAAFLPGLDEPGQKLYATWRVARDRGLQREAQRLLDIVIARLERFPPEHRRAWVERASSLVCDSPGVDPARERWRWFELPMLRRVVLPELLAGFEAGRAGCARWLACLPPAGPRGPLHDAYYAGERTEGWYLERALERDPGDARARDLLIDDVDGGMDYVLHELPAGVLQDPDELQHDLAVFERAARDAGRLDEFGDRLPHWRFHADAARRYREAGGSAGTGRSYDEFVGAREHPDLFWGPG